MLGAFAGVVMVCTEHLCSPVFPRGPVDIRISKDGKRSGVNLNLFLFFTPKLLLFSLKYTNLHRTAQHSVSRYLQCPQRPLKFLSSTPVVGLSVLRKGQCLHYLTTRHGSIRLVVDAFVGLQASTNACTADLSLVGFRGSSVMASQI